MDQAMDWFHWHLRLTPSRLAAGFANRGWLSTVACVGFGRRQSSASLYRGGVFQS
jgi:hypothetical protein